jgi:hypothetical protein
MEIQLLLSLLYDDWKKYEIYRKRVTHFAGVQIARGGNFGKL